MSDQEITLTLSRADAERLRVAFDVLAGATDVRWQDAAGHARRIHGLVAAVLNAAPAEVPQVVGFTEQVAAAYRSPFFPYDEEEEEAATDDDAGPAEGPERAATGKLEGEECR